MKVVKKFAVSFFFTTFVPHNLSINLNMKKLLVLIIALVQVVCVGAQEKIRVACVGNSITFGMGIRDREHDSYPVVLGRLLGEKYEVRNFGISARTLLNKGDHPYMNEQIYRDALAYNPDIVTIKLGTNDSKPDNWKYGSEFKDDLRTLIRSFQRLSSHPKIYLCLPIPPAHTQWGINDSTIVNGVIPAIEEVAKELNLPVIDLHTAFAPLTDLLPDAVHPNKEGAAIIAEELYKTISGGWTKVVNGRMWIDENGKSVQAHGAGFVLVGDTWYMIGEDRANSWQPDVNMYSSKDLQHWKFEGKIIENRKTHPDLGTRRFIERPKILWNRKTGKFVVWCHYEGRNYGASEAAVFVSDKVTGPYEFVWGGRPLGVKSRDCNVFQDGNGKAYFISTIEENQDIGVFELADDYLSAKKCTEIFKGLQREAPAVVKVGKLYYMLSSACTGWNPNQCKLSFSKHIDKGWSALENIGDRIAFDTQAASILTIKGTKQTTYLYVGDRWMDPTLPESKTIIFPVSFKDGKCDFRYVDEFEINFETGEVR